MASKVGGKPIPKKSLFDDSASSSADEDQDDGGARLAPSATLKINEEYARRFEHNKKREELHRLQEKYKSTGTDDQGSESSSEGEDEDDDAHLVTEDLEAEISATLQAIKNKDPRIYDKNTVFYKPFDPEKDAPKENKEKPVFLRDYHRERYLSGDVGADDETADKPKSYVQEQAELKKSIVSEFHAAVEDEEWSDDDAFLKPVKRTEETPVENGIHPSRAAAIQLTEVDVANADKNPEEFLSKFMASKSWAPAEGSKWQAFESDEGEDDPDIADEIEHAYNIRFEDPTKSNEILKTYSRNLAATKSVRKEELTGRKRQRALERERKQAEKREREEERGRLRRLKIEEASEKLNKIKQAAGLGGKALQDEDWVQFLAEDWSDNRWEEEMKKRFGDDYYAQEDADMSVDEAEDSEEGSGSKKKKKPKKPKWDDDIDIKDIVPDYTDEEKPDVSLSDLEDPAPAGEHEAEDDDDDSDSDSGHPSKKRKTSKDMKKDKIAAKRQARQDLAKIEALVDAQMEIDNPRAFASSSEKKNIGTFRYREVSPTSFGLTARDILLAPSDAALNDFAGLKKLAPFRDADKKRKDKKKLGKKARLRQWRREHFGCEYEETGPTFGFEKMVGDTENQGKTAARGANAVRVEWTSERKADEGGDDKKKAVNGIVEGERKKKRKRSKGKGRKTETEVEAS